MIHTDESIHESNESFQSRGLPTGDGDGRQTAGSIVDRTRQRVVEQVDEGLHKAEARMEAMCHSMHDAGNLLADENERLLAQGLNYAADRCEVAAQYLKSKSFNELSREAADLARSHPATFLGLSLLGGMVLGRFLRSSARHEDKSDGADAEGRIDYTPQPLSAASNWNKPPSAAVATPQGPSLSIRPTSGPQSNIQEPPACV